ncbi:MAG: hypothetical protein FJY10_09890 [Bacteroidetes bacterium]|nr:hypothetical protein [Bacteroidota bacterium]
MRQLLITIILLVTVIISWGQGTWLGFTQPDPRDVSVTLHSSSSTSVTFTVEIPGMYVYDTIVSGSTYKRLSLPGGTRTAEPGYPEIPYYSKLVAIPECQDINLLVTPSQTTSYSNFLVYPAPDFELINNNGVEYLAEVFVRNDSVYNIDLFSPLVNNEIASTGHFRAQRYAEIRIYPIHFNPVLQQIQVIPRFDVTLSFVSPLSEVNMNTGIFNNVASNVFLNFVSSGITASINTRPEYTGEVQWITLTDTAQAVEIIADYLIITDDIFFDPGNPNSELLRIANHRASYNGFDVAIVKVEEIMNIFYPNPPSPANDNEQKIRNFIKRVYQGNHSNHTYDGKLGYVLLVGNPLVTTNQGVPCSYDLNPGYKVPGLQVIYPSDYYYSCITHSNGTYDQIGDLFIGRFCVDESNELHNFISKIIAHETEASFSNWKYKNLMARTINDLPAQSISTFENNMYNFLESLYNNPYRTEIFSESQVLQPPLRERIVDSLNNGFLTMFWFGHGDIDEFMIVNGSILFQDRLTVNYLKENLDNAGKNTFVISYSCRTGGLDLWEKDCIGEAITSYSETKGFVGFLGVGRQSIVGTFSSNPPQEFEEFLYWSIFHDLSHIAGEFILESKIASSLISTLSSFAYNYFGDPALNLMAEGFLVTQFTLLPQITQITSEIQVTSGACLSVPPDGIVYFSDEGKIIVEPGGCLIINPNVTFFGMNGENKIDIYGDLYISENTTLTAPEGFSWGGLELNNQAAEITLNDFHFTTPPENAYLRITDLNGNMITSFPVNNQDGEALWDTRNVSPGMYFYSLQNGKYSANGKVAVVH